jgi:hypothetical protein
MKIQNKQILKNLENGKLSNILKNNLWGRKIKSLPPHKKDKKHIYSVNKNRLKHIWHNLNLCGYNSNILKVYAQVINGYFVTISKPYLNKSFCIKTILPKLQKEKDDNTYVYIKKNQNLKDISILKVLEVLFKSKKITKSQYKHAKQNLYNKEPLKVSVLEKINLYYKNNVSKIERSKHKTREYQKQQEKINVVLNKNKYEICLKRYHKKLNQTILLKEIENRFIASNTYF